MNLQEFIDYRNSCPICENTLTTYLVSTKSSIMEKLDDCHISYFRFNTPDAWEFRGKYCGAFIFDHNLHFHLEFYDVFENIRFSSVPISLIKAFLDYHSHLRLFLFKRECSNCCQYSYRSDQFPLDMTKCIVPPIQIREERIYLFSPLSVENSFRIYQLYNFPLTSETQLYVFMSDTIKDLWKVSPFTDGKYYSHLHLPLITFSSKEKMIQKLNDLLIYI